MRHALVFLALTTSTLYAQTTSAPDLPAWVSYAGAKIQPTRTEVFTVPDRGVLKDGRKLYTQAIQATIDLCADHGGGVIENFYFKDCQIEARSAARITQARGWQFDNVTIATPEGQALPRLTRCEDMRL